MFSLKKNRKSLRKTRSFFLGEPEVVLNQFDKFFSDRISDVFFKYTNKKTFVNRKRIFFGAPEVV